MLFWLKNKSNFYIVFKVKKKEVMTWYMNFCSPFIPNDSTINFHRLFQGILLTLYSVAYVAVHVYYLYWGPLPLEHQAEEPRTPPPTQAPLKKRTRKPSTPTTLQIYRTTSPFRSNWKNTPMNPASN